MRDYMQEELDLGLEDKTRIVRRKFTQCPKCKTSIVWSLVGYSSNDTDELEQGHCHCMDWLFIDPNEFV